MSAFAAAAQDEDGDTISALRAENEMLRQSLLTANDTLQKVARAGACHAQAAECLRETVIRWANRAEQAEAMLEAIGAGGVGKLGQPQVEQEPVAEVIESHVRAGLDGRFTAEVASRERLSVGAELFIHPQNLRCKSTQARLATLWGYEKPQPKREPLTEMEIVKLRQLTPGTLDVQFVKFAHAIERAHGITGENT